MHETLTLNLLDVHKDLKDTLENFMINIDVSIEDGTVIVTAYSNARKVMDHQFETAMVEDKKYITVRLVHGLKLAQTGFHLMGIDNSKAQAVANIKQHVFNMYEEASEEELFHTLYKVYEVTEFNTFDSPEWYSSVDILEEEGLIDNKESIMTNEE